MKWQVAVLALLFTLSFVCAVDYVWVGDGCDNVWSPSSSSSCWNPPGYPSSVDSIVIPEKQNLLISCPLNYTGNSNSFSTLYDYYAYGPTHAISITSFVVESGASLEISTFVSLIISEDSKIEEGGNLSVIGKLAALDGSGNLYSYGNVTLSEGNIEGTGELFIIQGGYLNLFGYESYLLRNTTIYGSMVQTNGITHTGFWWQAGSVTISVYGQVYLRGYLYDWEEAGYLTIEKGGYFTLSSMELRGLTLNNYGTLDISHSSTSFPLNRALNNYALMLNKDDNTLYVDNYEVYKNFGLFYSSENIDIISNFDSFGGIFFADTGIISFITGTSLGLSPTYYNGMYGTPPYYFSQLNQINLQQSIFTGNGSFSIGYGPVGITDHLFIDCDTILGVVNDEYSPTFYVSGNITINIGVELTIYGGGRFLNSEKSESSFYIHNFGTLVFENITTDLTITLYPEGFMSVTPSTTIILNLPVTAPAQLEVFGTLNVQGNLTTSQNVVVHSGGSLEVPVGGSLYLVGGAAIVNCGGNLDLYGQVFGPTIPCSSLSTNSFVEKERERVTQLKAHADASVASYIPLVRQYL